MLEKRYGIPQAIHDKYSNEAVKRIQSHPLYQQSKVIGLYHPIKQELNLVPITNDQDKVFLLPVVEGDEMHFHVYDQDATLTKSHLNILEPKDNPILDESLELLIVPALAVNHQGDRVGYGKGYFDRFLKQHPHIHTLTVVLDFQVLEDIPVESTDHPIQHLLIIKGEHHDH